MEAFSLLNYWKNSGGVSSGLSFLPQSSDSTCRYSGEATTIVTSVSVTGTEDETTDDEGPFFDLEFAVPVDEEGEDSNQQGEFSDDDSKGGRGGERDSNCTDRGCEFKFTLSSCSGGEDRVDPDLDVSPSDEVYFKGHIVEEEEVEPQSSSSTSTDQTCSVKAPAAQLSASILKSATKLRVFMLGMKKSKLIQGKSEAYLGSEDFSKRNPPPSQPLPHSPESQQKGTVTVNLKVEEVPIISLFTRDNSSRNSSSSSSPSSSKKQNGNESVVSEENRFVMMQKYLKKVKPLYIRVSRRYGEKLKQSGHLTFGSSIPSSRSTSGKSESPASTKSHKPGNINIPAGLKVVRKHLGKSRSSSSTTTTPSSTSTTVTTPTESRRRDDSLLQQQDSIQSAILHCKRSFNSSRGKDPSVLPRSVSEPSSYDK